MVEGAGDAELVAAFARGDLRAFERFYERHVDALWRHGVHELGTADETQEHVQEVFEIAWRKRRSIRIVEGSAAPWLLATSRNLLANRSRRARRGTASTAAIAAIVTMSEADDFEDAELRVLVSQMEKEVMTMSELDQKVYWALFRGELSYPEVAQLLGISLPSVKKRAHRLRMRLREHFLGAV